MITIEELTSKQRAYRAAETRHATMVQMQEAHLVTSQAVKDAWKSYESLKADYDRCAWDYHQQINAKPAGGRQRA